MIMTLSNWKTQLTAKGLSHNETVRLLQDAQEQMDAQKVQNAVDSEAAQSLTCVISDIAALVGIRDSAPNLCRETVKAVKQLVEERDALRAALRELVYTLADRRYPVNSSELRHAMYHEIDNARRVLGEVGG